MLVNLWQKRITYICKIFLFIVAEMQILNISSGYNVEFFYKHEKRMQRQKSKFKIGIASRYEIFFFQRKK